MSELSDHLLDREIRERPPEYYGPNLSPVGLELRAQELGQGVHALMANVPPKDNNGVVSGTKASLIIDSGVTPAVGAQVQRVAGEVTSRPLRYLANTTYHGDHTFGNIAFPDDVTVITSRENRDNMNDLAYEKEMRAGNMYGAEAEFDAFTTWRLPDVVFDTRAEIDLGGTTVELHRFGPGNGPGDTIVYVPSARTAWTGNFLCPAGSAHMMLQGGPVPYLHGLRAMKAGLPELETIVPGHGPMGDGPQAIDALIAYLERLQEEVSTAYRAGVPIDEVYDRCTDPWAGGLDPEFAARLDVYTSPSAPTKADYLGLCRQLHRICVLTTYRICEKVS
ncbi:MBL fold metallo-hydrolase [Nonomuraea mesophila]|uniref:MBL fold metallo-hydrolase n=1 Tax=Nonomuraea mesophila TaxID=2530382 RepID=A0A4R5FA46_9ACTN|nr:MBL fold metallo-hydrolase [Nonomuraea mesophila]TDE45304.1 MBL fold metallo-hydrolase [Nonomuraea mesophila]